MAYSELIKNFIRVRSYMRDFYIYGFKSRDEFDGRSARSYDNERRRIESYLNDYMGFRNTPSGKNVFISIDSRNCRRNPLYKAFKSKSFTDGDITLHFIIMDILHSPEISLTLNEMSEKIDAEYLLHFHKPMMFDESTLRKKLKEYVGLGLINAQKVGQKMYYSRSPDIDISAWTDAVDFFSEAGILGVVGSYLLDKLNGGHGYFSFKHHYITNALDNEILYQLFEAMHKKRTVRITVYNRHRNENTLLDVIPLKIFFGTQNGRNYLIAYSLRMHAIKSYRLDFISSVTDMCDAPNFDELRGRLEQYRRHMWGINCDKRKNGLQHIEFTLYVGDREKHIFQRLEREKRCGTVEITDEHTCKFSADVYDLSEMIPWVRTFICRITSLNMSDEALERRFKHDIKLMYQMYGISDENGDDCSDIQ